MGVDGLKDNTICLFSDVCLITNVQSLVIFQDLLSFELLDINIVQELEKVPANTPAGKASFWSQLCNISSCSVPQRHVRN